MKCQILFSGKMKTTSSVFRFESAQRVLMIDFNSDSLLWLSNAHSLIHRWSISSNSQSGVLFVSFELVLRTCVKCVCDCR